MFKNKTRPLRILIVGIPKSGTSILTYRIADSMNKPNIYFEPKQRKGLNDVKFHQKVCNENKMPVITKNLYFHGQPKQVKEIVNLYDKIIWIIRDPRDVLISSFLYRWYHGHKPDKEIFNKVINMVRKKEKDPGSVNFFQIINQYSNPVRFIINQMEIQSDYIANLNEVQDKVYIFKYEDLIDGNLKDLENYIQLSMDKDAELPEKLNRVARSKAYGDWRNWFTANDCSFFRAVFYEFLGKLNYDAEDWTINDPQKINPSEASEYMQGIFNDK